MSRKSTENPWFAKPQSVKNCLAVFAPASGALTHGEKGFSMQVFAPVAGALTRILLAPSRYCGVSAASWSWQPPEVTRVAATICTLFVFANIATAQVPDLSANWIRAGGIVFGEWEFTEAGQLAFDDYDFARDDPAYDCIGASWTRIWLNPNVLVRITQAEDHVRLQYEWMDIDRVVPLSDANDPDPERSHLEGMPALGRSTAWYDGDTLVIDTVDFAPGYVSTMAEWAGTPQSRRMRTVERISRDADVLTIETTHQDPAYYRRPLVVTIPYARSDFELLEYGCTPEDAAIVAPN